MNADLCGHGLSLTPTPSADTPVPTREGPHRTTNFRVLVRL